MDEINNDVFVEIINEIDWSKLEKEMYKRSKEMEKVDWSKFEKYICALNPGVRVKENSAMKKEISDEIKKTVEKMMRVYKEMEEKIENLKKEQKKVLQDAREICTHPELDTKCTYFPETVDEKAYTLIETTCVLCGKLVDTRTKEGA